MQRRRLRLVVCAVAVLIAASALVLFVRPPRPVLRTMLNASSGWLLESGDNPLKDVVRVYLQTAVASYLADEVLRKPATDEELLMEMMLLVRRSIVSVRSDWQLSFNPKAWPALISGVGWCDQVNGAVCTVAAQHFPKAELISLYLPAEQWSPHTIARVWSEQRNEWLYFDAFYRDPVIFTKGADGRVRVVKIARRSPANGREPAPPGIYTLDTWKLTEFRATFGTYLYQRVRERLFGATPESTMPATEPQVAETPAPADSKAVPNLHAETGVTHSQQTDEGWVFPAQQASHTLAAAPQLRQDPAPVFPNKVDDALYQRVVEAYTRARVMHLLGKPDRDAYRVVAASAHAQADDRASQIVATARSFVARPEL